MIDRIRFVCCCVMLGPPLLMSMGLAAEENSVAGPELRWDFSLWGKKRAGTEAAESLARQLIERTDGKWQVKLHYGEVLSKSRENLDGLSIGAFEGAMFCNFYHPRKNPALMVLSLPFLPMSTAQESLAVREAVYAHPEVKREMVRWNANLYVSTLLPQYEFMGRGKPPRSLSEWKGKTVRAGGGLGQAMRMLGAAPTSSTATEVYTGLQQGTMDAAAMPFTYAHVSYRLHEVSDWYTANLAPGSADCPIALSARAYIALPPQYRQLLDDIRSQVIADQLQAYVEEDRVNLPLIRASLEQVEYSAQQREEFRNVAARPVVEQWIADNANRFDARSLVETVYTAVGQAYE